jgi:hypothetical protein
MVNQDGTIRIRCLREQCDVGTATLARGAWRDVAADSDVLLTLH